MDGHSLSWNAVAAIGFCGWLIGAAGALLLVGIWRVLRRMRDEQ